MIYTKSGKILTNGSGVLCKSCCPDEEPPFVPGETCPLCVGSLWGTGETPKYVTATFSGLEPCEFCTAGVGTNCHAGHGSMNSSFTLTQSNYAANYCSWYYSSSVWRVTYSVYTSGGIGYSALTLIRPNNYIFFYSTVTGCISSFNNQPDSLGDCCTGWTLDYVCAYNGTGVVTW